MHYKTIEFTRDKEITRRGSCVVGVGADFAVAPLKQFTGKIRITLIVGEVRDVLTATVNPGFSDEHEVVLRRGTYASSRTLGIRASKSALRVDREIIRRMQHPATQMLVTIEQITPDSR